MAAVSASTAMPGAGMGRDAGLARNRAAAAAEPRFSRQSARTGEPRGTSWLANSYIFGFCQTVAVAVDWIGGVVIAKLLIIPEHFNWELCSMVILVLSFAGRWLVSL